MNILITGNEGFIGTELTEYLRNLGHSIIGVDIKSGLDIDEIDETLVKSVDMVVHLAAYVQVPKGEADPEGYWKNNAEKTKRLQRLCYMLNVPLIYASSSCARQFGKSVYGATKKANELTAYAKQIGLRFTTVYGGKGRDEMFISKLINCERVYYNDCTRDFIYVGDVCRVINKVINNYDTIREPVIEVGSGVKYSIESLAFKYAVAPVVWRMVETYEALDNSTDIPSFVLECVQQDLDQYIMEKRNGIPSR